MGTFEDSEREEEEGYDQLPFKIWKNKIVNEF